MKITPIIMPRSFGNSNLIKKIEQDNKSDVKQNEDKISIYDTKNIVCASFFYINDIHGKMTNIERLLGIVNEFDKTDPKKITSFYKNVPQEKIIKMKVSSGDIILGTNDTHTKVANMLLNKGGFTASALGNHEVDICDPIKLKENLSESKFKMLAANVKINENSPIKDKIEKSFITEQNGEKFGIIGIAPSDIKQRVKKNDTLKDLEVADINETIRIVKEEVKKLQAQGINKIILLSHSGAKNDKRIAQEVDGIDVIFGAHTHELFKGIEEGQNLFYSKLGEPIIITQAGKDGDNVGLLNIEFNKDGIITRAQNNIINVRQYNRPLPIKYHVETIIGKSEIVGQVKSSVAPPTKRLIENNPHGNIVVDAMRHELNTDIGLLNAGNIRGSFSEGPIDTRLISDITPFEDKMLILNLTEEQIIKAIKHGCKSVTKSSNRPGIMLVSGLKYTFNKNGELLTLDFIDKNENKHRININNPDPNKKYTVAVDGFFAVGGDGYIDASSGNVEVVQKLDVNKDKLTASYIKQLKQPLEIKKDDRVIMVD